MDRRNREVCLKMAISISENYPGKTAGNTADYPYGQARNITTPGDGTGTPWEAAIVNDDQGMKQALLTNAGITPSGTPDTADESQYFEAMKKLFGAEGALGDTGSIEFPVFFNGALRIFVVKWGTWSTATYPGEGDRVIQFAKAFPNACAGVQVTRMVATGTVANNDGGVHVVTWDKTRFTANLADFNGTSTGGLRGFTWLAIGF